MTRGDLGLCALMFLGSFAACVTNHEALEKKPDVGGGGAGRGGASGVSGSHGQLGGSGGDAASSGGHADDEPPGTSLLTIVNGVVDAPRVALCLAKVDTDANVVPFGDPLTEAPLDYAHSVVLHDVAGADLAEDTLQPFVIAGELELIAGMDCAAAIELAQNEEAATVAQAVSVAQAGAGAGGDGSTGDGGASGESAGGSAGAAGAGPVAVRSRLRARGLPAISAGTLTQGRSLALVANGCMGGATYSDANAVSYCGDGYSERTPSLSAVLVSLSRQHSFDHVGLQVVHASLANSEIQVRVKPPFPSQESGFSIAGQLTQGQVAPRPASVVNTAFDLGSDRSYRVEVSAGGEALFSESWATVLENGGLTALANATTYALVLSGPRGDLKAVSDLWNAPALTVIAVDPQ